MPLKPRKAAGRVHGGEVLTKLHDNDIRRKHRPRLSLHHPYLSRRHCLLVLEVRGGGVGCGG